ncbi:MAG: alpha/beta hydrolase [Dehalococcoidia bacterium]
MSELEAPDYALLDRAGGAASMFYPRPEDYEPPEGASDHAIEVATGVHIGARWYPRSEARAALLYFHGNGEIASDHDGIAPMYHDIGASLVVAEFRGYGHSNGTPSMAALVGDAHPAAAYFHRLLDAAGFEGARFVMGRSLGAHPALEVAANVSSRFSGLILESGAAGIRRVLERTGLLDTELGGTLAAAHDAKVRSIRLPVLQIHGEQDDLVPLRTAHELGELLEGTKRTLVTIPRAGHNDLLWLGRERYFEAIRDFIEGASEPGAPS